MTSKANKQPLSRPHILFSFALGLAFVQQLPILPDALISIFLLLLSLAVCIARPRFALPGALLAGIAYAMLAGSLALSKRLDPAYSGRTGDAVVEVIGLPSFERDQWQLQAKVLHAPDFSGLDGRRIKLAWYRTQATIRPGDVWRFKVMLRVPNGVQNPGGFDAEQRALAQAVAAQGYIKHAQFLFAHNSLDRWRDRLSGQIASTLGAEHGRFVQALALGDTRALSDTDWERLRQTGITHLIAISGFHVGIVALFAAWLLQAIYFLRPQLGMVLPRPIAVALVSIAAAVAYTAMAGFAIATVRTAWMIAVFMLARCLYRSIGVLHAVALSMLAMLLWDPFCILNSGFWLSFAGVLLLALGMPNDSKPSWLRSFLRAQILVSIGLLPLTVALFGQTTVIGPLVNLIAIPLISLVIVPLALLGCLFSANDLLSHTFWKLAAWLMEQFWQLLAWAAQSPWASVYVPEPSLAAILMALLAVILCALPKPVPGRAMACLLFLPLLYPAQPKIEHGTVRVAVMDVGQGLAVLLQTESHTLLYDTGAGNANGFSRGEATVLPALRARAITHLDKVVISHQDNDHSGGFAAVQAGIPISHIYMPQVSGNANSNTACRAGQHWHWDGIDFEVLWPITPLPDADNDQSCVLMIKTAGQQILLTGDISQAVESQLLARYPNELRASILLVPHHGSKTSSSSAFLDQVKPELALVSSGFQNRFRHPNADVVARYQAHGIALAGSVENGWSELLVGADSWRWWHRERVDDQRYWMRNSQQAP